MFLQTIPVKEYLHAAAQTAAENGSGDHKGVINVVWCPRCGDNHPNLDIKPFSGNTNYLGDLLEWGMCENTGEPLLISAGDGKLAGGPPPCSATGEHLRPPELPHIPCSWCGLKGAPNTTPPRVEKRYDDEPQEIQAELFPDQ